MSRGPGLIEVVNMLWVSAPRRPSGAWLVLRDDLLGVARWKGLLDRMSSSVCGRLVNVLIGLGPGVSDRVGPRGLLDHGEEGLHERDPCGLCPSPTWPSGRGTCKVPVRAQVGYGYDTRTSCKCSELKKWNEVLLVHASWSTSGFGERGTHDDNRSSIGLLFLDISSLQIQQL